MTFKKLLTQNNLIKYRKNEADKKRLQLKQRLSALSLLSEEALLQEFNQSMNGFNEEQAELMREKYGTNTLPKQKADWAGLRLLRCLFTPFTLILIALMGISVITDVVMVSAKDQDFSKIIIIFVMITLSTVIRFIQETKSSREAEKLNEMVETTTLVYRNQSAKEIPADEVVAGDLVRLAAGDLVVADVRILQAKDLFISQASLSGESDPLEKQGIALSEPAASVTDSENLAFMGSNVISGSALCMVIAVGSDTFFGSMAESFSEPQDATSFEKGMNAVTKILMRFMLVMVPIVFVINGFTKHDWLSAFMFAVSIAVGMTPEMLPMIVTTCLAKGALVMSKQKTIIKDLNAIQNFGAMDILCTDKTGTLTQNRMTLVKAYAGDHLHDLDGEEQVALKRGGIHQIHDRHRLFLGLFGREHGTGDDFLLRVRRQGIRAGKVHHEDLNAVDGDVAFLLVDGDAGIIPDMLMGSGIFVERRGFPAVRVPRQRNADLFQRDVLRLAAVLAAVRAIGMGLAHATSTVM